MAAKKWIKKASDVKDEPVAKKEVGEKKKHSASEIRHKMYGSKKDK